MWNWGARRASSSPTSRCPARNLPSNDRIKVYVLEVSRQGRGPQVYVSRTHPGLVKRLFELEVPELVSGVVQIKAIAREAGFRTKMAVFSTDPLIDAVGSCVGPRGMRVENVVSELKTEKIDIIKWSSDPAEYIANALNPARVISVFTADGEKSARVIVPDNQLSLAIGKEGQNARLAAKLTGWKIDIKSQSQVEQMIAEGELAAEGDTVADDGFDLDAAVESEDLLDLGDIEGLEGEATWAVKPDAAQAEKDPHAHVRGLPRNAAQGRTSARGQAAGRRGAHRFQGQGPGPRRVYLPQRRMLQARPQDPRPGTRAGNVHFPRGVRRPGGTTQAR